MRSFVSCLLHCVFSTKHRERWLTADVRERLRPYLAGIGRELGVTVIAVGGVEDHAHILIALPSTLSVAKGAASAERKFVKMDS